MANAGNNESAESRMLLNVYWVPSSGLYKHYRIDSVSISNLATVWELKKAIKAVTSIEPQEQELFSDSPEVMLDDKLRVEDYAMQLSMIYMAVYLRKRQVAKLE